MQRYSDIIVETVDTKGRGLALRGLLDSGCSKTIVLKKFTTNINKDSKAVKYHNTLIHPGETRMEGRIRSIYTWKNLRKDQPL